MLQLDDDKAMTNTVEQLHLLVGANDQALVVLPRHLGANNVDTARLKGKDECSETYAYNDSP